MEESLPNKSEKKLPKKEKEKRVAKPRDVKPRTDEPREEKPRLTKPSGIIFDILLIGLLIVGAILRSTGLDWDQGFGLHPDERFLKGVESVLVPVDTFDEYWNTEESTLNPNNQGAGYFVYGTLPLFMIRYVAEWVDKADYGNLYLVGRQLSGIADLGVILLVYLISVRLYSKRTAIVAAAFATFSVLPIQLSHFLTVDAIMNFFIALTIYFGVRILTEGDPTNDEFKFSLKRFLWFGVGLGLAVASKVNAVVVAVLLPIAVAAVLSKMSAEKRDKLGFTAMIYMVLAAVASLITFRIFQPYAFAGPGFFNMSINQAWFENIRSVISQSAGDVDWPPSIQWARRSFWFSGKNMVLWGMGIPMGIAAWGGFLWASVKIFKGEWQKHSVIWFWTGAYFFWQSLAFNPTMRYELPIYPTMAIFAGWGVTTLWEKASQLNFDTLWAKIARPAAYVFGALLVGLTAAYAFAFTNIYREPVTRLAASKWIYQNVPGPINLHIESEDGVYNQPIRFQTNQSITANAPYSSAFSAKSSGTVSEIEFNHILTPATRNLTMTIEDLEFPGTTLNFASAEVIFDGSENQVVRDAVFASGTQLIFTTDKQYKVRIALQPNQGEVTIHSVTFQLYAPSEVEPLNLTNEPITITQDQPFEALFSVDTPLTQGEMLVLMSVDNTASINQQEIGIRISEGGVVIGSGKTMVNLAGGRSDGDVIVLDEPIEITEGILYQIEILNHSESDSFTLLGSAITIESGWDDPLPYQVDGYVAYGGIYQADMNFRMEYNADEPKRTIMIDLLEVAEFITISSSRQWASTIQIPERFPLVIGYYRSLLGCPEERSIESCYNVAEPGMFEGELGFELVKIFQSDPTLGPFSINDQPSEEAFTVYDHPKVFIFKKTEAYDHRAVTTIMNAIDLSNYRRLTPKEASGLDGGIFGSDDVDSEPVSLLLPEDRLEDQRTGGTWSDLFDYNSPINYYQGLTVIVWYLAVGVLGLAAYPLVRAALPGLPDKGYPLGRIFGLLLLSYLSWIAGSVGLSFTRGWIITFYILIVIAGGILVFRNREKFLEDWKTNKKYYLMIEAAFLAFFLLALFVRLGNPDLWHPAKGGEKPMDFAYLNAIIKSTTFPAYDPWFSGGYINYYYYGFVYVGTLIKMLGIVPTIAYNLVIPTIFAFLSIGTFSVGWNLFAKQRDKSEDTTWKGLVQSRSPFWIGLAGSLMTALFGNFGSIRMIVVGWQRVGGAGLYDEAASFVTRVIWTFQGMFATLSSPDVGLPYGFGHWYWNPSRVIPAPGDVPPITEFPWFTTIYADLHAHLMALPLTVLVIAWVVSAVRGRAWQSRNIWWTLWSFFFVGLSIGALRPTNTWDFPTYLALALVVTAYVILRFYQPPKNKWTEFFDDTVLKILATIGGLAVVGGLSFFLFQPFANWYEVGYSSVRLWPSEFATQTPISSYFTHWGLFLFVITSWLVWETRQWMASTPLSSLRKLSPYRFLIQLTVLFFGLVVVGMNFGWKINIAWIALPLATWAAVLLFRPDLPEAKRLTLFMVGTSMFLTLMVEVIVLEGDIGRMNTVFKFYLQAWVLFSVSSAAAFGWLISELDQWKPSLRALWTTALTVMVGMVALFPILGTAGKIADRMTKIPCEAPRENEQCNIPVSLDGMDYMNYSVYHDQNTVFDLSEDYQAIRWMQENVEGSPVIVEGHAPIYRWTSRFTIYTGLPAVLGWDWHQIQQRVAGPPGSVEGRRSQVINFYQTLNVSEAMSFLDAYQVEYIVLGQLERAYFPGLGLDKFVENEGILWEQVCCDGLEDTVIYQVIREED